MGSKKQKIILLVAKLMSKSLKIDISFVNLKLEIFTRELLRTFKREQPNNTSELVDGKIP